VILEITVEAMKMVPIDAQVLVSTRWHEISVQTMSSARTMATTIMPRLTIELALLRILVFIAVPPAFRSLEVPISF
jgi:hypothetical protein